MGPAPFPAWVRRAVEAAAAGAILAIGSLLGTGLSSGAEPVALPNGLPGSILLAPAVFSLGVLTTAYPVALAATRSDALLGAFAAFLVAADLTVIVAGGPVTLDGAGIQLGAGLLAALAAFGSAAVGLAAGQAASPLGFGRRAGAWTAIAAAVAAAAVLVIIGMLA
jgi:hypothetical protein